MKFTDIRVFVIYLLIILLGAIALRLSAGRAESPVVPHALPVLPMQGGILQPILPLAAIPDLDPRRVALGERLFHDSRLSADFSLSCATCHNLAKGGVDGRRVSVGIRGALGGINAPSVLNSGYSIAQFWDGRAASLEEQAAGPIQNPIEMGATLSQVMGRLEQDKGLMAEFRRAYADGLTEANLFNALATFERSLVTLNSRFDRFLRGEKMVLSANEIEGYRSFRELGCTSCHQGILIGGNMYQKFGVLGDYFATRPTTPADLGRFNVTQREEDRHVFKVPSLRNVALTAPYFHDGSAETLEQAVSVMARYQLGRDLSTGDIECVVAFLMTLTGEQPMVAAQ